MKIQIGCKLPEWKITHCPWNPRPEITKDSVSELAASIKGRGLIQEIGVMRIPGSKEEGDAPCWWAIYGNRRLVACRLVGITAVPVKIYDCTELEAREITRIENEQRLGVSPLEDAKLIKSMMDMGFEEQEIAAHLGVSNATVCRRAKLIDLDEGYHAIAGNFTAMALERIAAYPVDIQRNLLASVRGYGRGGHGLQWSTISHLFDNATRDLERAPWFNGARGLGIRAKCVRCINRTGAQPNLFGDIEGGDNVGRCLDAECYEGCFKEFVADLIKRSVSPKAESVQEVDDEWKIPCEASDKPSRRNNCAWVIYNRYSGELKVKYYVGPDKLEEERRKKQLRMEKEEEASRRAFRVLQEAREKIDVYLSEREGEESDAAVRRVWSDIADSIVDNRLVVGWLVDKLREDSGSSGWGRLRDVLNLWLAESVEDLGKSLTDEEMNALRGECDENEEQ